MSFGKVNPKGKVGGRSQGNISTVNTNSVYIPVGTVPKNANSNLVTSSAGAGAVGNIAPAGSLFVGNNIISTGTSDQNVLISMPGSSISGNNMSNTVAIITSGSSNLTSNAQCVTIGGVSGHNAGAGSVCIGYGSSAAGVNNMVIGTSAASNGASGIAIGAGAAANAASATAIGAGAAANAVSTISIGLQAKADFQGEINICNAAFASQGDIHISDFPLYQYTTNATPTELATAQSGTSTTPATYIAFPANSTYAFTIDIVAKVQGAGTVDAAMWTTQFLIQRGSTAASTTLIGTPSGLTSPLFATTGATTGAWAVAVTADTTNGRAAIKVTGQAATNIAWVANVRMTKVGY